MPNGRTDSLIEDGTSRAVALTEGFQSALLVGAGFAVIGAILLAGEQKSTFSTVLGTIAIVAATSNLVGGFIITDRMLKMFRSSGGRKP